MAEVHQNEYHRKLKEKRQSDGHRKLKEKRQSDGGTEGGFVV